MIFQDRLSQSFKYEAVSLNGTPYLRLTEEDGRPLSGEAAQEEEKRYLAAVYAC